MSDPVPPEVDTDAYLLRDRKFHSIVPRSSVAGNALTLVIAIMAFLASLTLGAVSMVNDTARNWQSDIAREITVQVRPVDGIDMEENLTDGQTDKTILGYQPDRTWQRVRL